MTGTVNKYLATLNNVVTRAEVTDKSGSRLDMPVAIDEFIKRARASRDSGNNLMFIGNGGSAGIASHSAADYSMNGGFPSLALNDSSLLTCLGNDFGYEHVYDKQINYFGRPGDILIAISSSGASKNILNAVDAARVKECGVITFSGFKPDNPLRQIGDLNFYVPSSEYGFVELSHQILIHAMLDLSTGWQG